MKKNNRILIKLICIALLIFCLLIVTLSTVDAKFVDDNEFSNPAEVGTISSAIDNTAVTIITAARIIGVAIATVMLITIAIKYMVSSAGDRADIKKHAVAYVVGAVVLFGAVGILGIIETVAENITSE